MQKIVMLMLFLLLTSVEAKYCKDFNTQSEAQKYFKTHNAKGLDRDKDGEACECLKGGSGYNKSGCKSWRKKNNKR
jgi:hypothetical protein